MEFVEVMRHMQRICDTTLACRKCPLSALNNGCDLSCSMFMMREPEKAEEVIMNWTKGHPMKTNRQVAEEILTEKFGDILDMSAIAFNCRLLKQDCPDSTVLKATACEECDIKDFWDNEYKEVIK